MRGRIVVWEPASQGGLIVGDDGLNYVFFSDAVLDASELCKGIYVVFQPANGVARDVRPMVQFDGAVRGIQTSMPSGAQGPSPTSPLIAGPQAVGRLSLWGGFERAMRYSFRINGRASRKEFWGHRIFSSLLVLLPLWLKTMFYDNSGPDALITFFNAIYYLSLLALIPSSITVLIRRFRDVDWSPWLILLYIPILFAIFKSSKQVVTRYGPPASTPSESR